MRDVNTPNIRERVWVEIIDHTVEPPRPVEEIFIENGEIRERRRLDGQLQHEEAPHGDSDR